MRIFNKIMAMITGLLICGLYVAAASGEEALKFKHITSIYADGQGLGLRHPEGVACDRDSALFIADTGNARILQYVYKDNAVAAEPRVIKLPQLVYPGRIKLNSRNDIFVLDGKRRRIVRIGSSGKFAGYIDLQGSSSATAAIPQSFNIDKKDNIYILDVYSRRVVMLDPRGKYLKDFRFSREHGFITDLTVDFKGNILLIDSVNAKVFSNTGKSAAFIPITESLKEYMRFPTAIATDRMGRIYLVDRNGGRIIIVDQHGGYLGRLSTMGWKEGLLNYPAQICLNDSGEIFVADTNNSRVQIFSIIE